MTSLAVYNPTQLETAFRMLRDGEILPLLSAGKRGLLSFKPETRRDAQNAHFHSLIGQISAHVGGDLADEEDAKRILLSAFRIDTLNDPTLPDLKEEWRKFGDVRIGRGLRGETVLMGNQTRDLSVKLAGAFITWLEAFGAEHSIVFKAPRSWENRR